MATSKEQAELDLTVEMLQRNAYFTELNKMRQEGIDTDVVLVCGDKEFPAHRLVLTAASPFFRKVFESDFKESFTKRVDFSHVDEHVLSVIIDFIYSPSKRIILEDLDNLKKIHSASHLFDLNNLNDICWNLITEQTNVDNCLIIWNEAMTYGKTNDVEKIENYIVKNINDVVETADFFDLQKERLKSVVEKMHQENIPTTDALLESIVSWVKKNEDRKPFLYEMMPYLHFDLVSIECLDQVLTSENFIRDDKFLSQFLRLQIKPKMKSKTQIEDLLRNPVSKAIPQVKMFLFGCWKNWNSNGKITKKIFGMICFDIKSKTIEYSNLEFSLNIGMACVYYESKFYFIGGFETDESDNKCINGPSQIFFTYDWRTKKIEYKPFLPEAVGYPQACVVQNKIYVIGGRTALSTSCMSIQIFSINEHKWNKINLDIFSLITPTLIFGYINVSGMLYLCINDTEKRKRTYRWINGACYYKSECWVDEIDSKLTTVYQNKWYYFVHGSYSKCNGYIYNTKTEKWEKFEIKCTEEKLMEYCFSSETEGIFFYNGCYEIFHLDLKKYEIQRVTSIEELKKYIKDNENRINFSFTYEILKMCNV